MSNYETWKQQQANAQATILSILVDKFRAENPDCSISESIDRAKKLMDIASLK